MADKNGMIETARDCADALGLTRLSAEDVAAFAGVLARAAEMANDLPTDLRPEEEPAFQFRVGRPSPGRTVR